MARTFTGPQRTAIGAAHVNHYWYFEVMDTGGTWRNLGTLGGVDWQTKFDLGADIDQRTLQGTLTLQREDVASGKSLAPLITASSFNIVDSSFSPLLYGGRRMRMFAAVTGPGVAPSTWIPMGLFKIDKVDWHSSDSEITIEFRDIGAFLLARIIEDNHNYGLTAGRPALDVMNDIIADYPPRDGAIVVAIDDPDFDIVEYQQDRKAVLDAINDIALQAAGDVRYDFDASDNFVLMFRRPNRAKTVPDWTIGPSEYDDVTQLSTGDADVRNAIRGWYTDSITGLPTAVDAISTDSIDEFDRIFMEIAEEATSQINTNAEMVRMVNAARDDLAFPKADQEIRTRFFWPVQLFDLGRFSANGIHYDVDIDLGITGFRHTGDKGEIWTTMAVRGGPAGGFRTWINKQRDQGKPLPTGPIIITVTPTASDDESITVRVDATAPGSSTRPTVRVESVYYDTAILVGAAEGVDVPSGSSWKFARTAGVDSYPGIIRFKAKHDGYDDVDYIWPVSPIDASQTLIISVQPLPSSSPSRIAFRISVVDPQDQGGSYLNLDYDISPGLDVFEFGTTTPGTTPTLASGGHHDYEAVMQPAGGIAQSVQFIVEDANGLRNFATQTVTVPPQSNGDTGSGLYDPDAFGLILFNPATDQFRANWHWNGPTEATFDVYVDETGGGSFTLRGTAPAGSSDFLFGSTFADFTEEPTDPEVLVRFYLIWHVGDATGSATVPVGDYFHYDG